MEKPKSNILPIVSSKEAALAALKIIEEGRTGEQQGLLSRWEKVNFLNMGAFRFGKQYVIAGMSGGGKSWILNMLRKDFLDPTLNGDFKKPYRLIHFAFEMSAADEVIRSTSSKVQSSYADLISAYSCLSEEKYREAREYLQSSMELDIDYVEVTGTVSQVHDTIMWYQGNYPQHNLIISLDHTLLADYSNEKTEVELISKLSGMMIAVRKKISSMNFIIAQLNSDIEDIKRISTPSMHYPTKRDIHGSKAVYRDADFVMVAHVPEKLGITRYGRTNKDTSGKLFLHQLKGRHVGDGGFITFQQNYQAGTLDYIEPEKKENF